MSTEDESERVGDETGKRILELQKTVGNKEVGRILNLEETNESSEMVKKESDEGSASRRRNRFSGGSSLDGRGIRPSSVAPFNRMRKSNNRLEEFVDRVFAGRGKAGGLGVLVKRYDLLDMYDFSGKLELLARIRQEFERHEELKGVGKFDKGLENLYAQVCKEEAVIAVLKNLSHSEQRGEKIKVLQEAWDLLENVEGEVELKESLSYLSDYIEKELNRLS